jgi:hypothetical protein
VADDAKVHRNPTLISMIDLDKYELFNSDGHLQMCVAFTSVGCAVLPSADRML